MLTFAIITVSSSVMLSTRENSVYPKSREHRRKHFPGTQTQALFVVWVKRWILWRIHKPRGRKMFSTRSELKTSNNITVGVCVFSTGSKEDCRIITLHLSFTQIGLNGTLKSGLKGGSQTWSTFFLILIESLRKCCWLAKGLPALFVGGSMFACFRQSWVSIVSCPVIPYL